MRKNKNPIKIFIDFWQKNFITKRILLFFVFLFMLIYFEFLYQYFIFNNLLTINLLTITYFLIPLSLFLYIISSILKRKINRFIIILLVFIISILYYSQFIFYKTYDSIYSFSATQQVHAVGEFFNFVLQQISNNLFASALFFLPLILFIIFYKKLLFLKPLNFKFLAPLLILIIVIHLITVNNLNTQGIYSDHNLYYKTNAPSLTAEQLGLLTTMRLDLTRSIMGFEESSGFLDIERPSEEEEKEVEEIVEYNEMMIDWEDLIANETNETIKKMHKYFQNQAPTNKNDWTGKFEGKNLVWILAESLDHIAIDEELTPTLYRLTNEGLNFTNFYTPIFLSTIDGEYMTKTGLLPKAGVWSLYRSHNNYHPFSIPYLLKNEDYYTRAFHNGEYSYYRRHLSHPNLGYEEYIACGNKLDINCRIWPSSDQEMIDSTIDSLIENKPFVSYYLTISGHLEYNRYNQMAVRHWDHVKDLTYSTPIKCYLAQHIEFDNALASLIEHLEESELAEDTVIAISSDHWPYGLRDANYLNERSEDVDRTKFFERDRLPFIIWHKGIEGAEIDKLSSSIDILPTLLNLFGLEYDSRLMVGQDIFADTDPIVIYSNRNWLTETGRYYNNQNEFIPHNEDKEIPPDYIATINKKIYNRFQISRQILDENYYHHLFK